MNKMLRYKNINLFRSVHVGAYKSTTILTVRKGNDVVIIGDGQVSAGNTIVKTSGKKVRRIGNTNDVVVGFAGATADCITMVDNLESMVERHPDNLMKACVELVKEWRTNRTLRSLEAQIVAVDSSISLVVDGYGNVMESQNGILAIGSGSDYARAAATALIDFPQLSAEEIAKRAMDVAANICLYTNHNWTIERLQSRSQL